MASISFTTSNKQLTFGTSFGEIVAAATLIGWAQQFGSALYNRYTHQPLKELISALNSDTDIAPRRFHGLGVYDDECGKFMTPQGEIKAIAMGELTVGDEAMTPMGSAIVCLSRVMSRGTFVPILASSVMIFIHGRVEQHMQPEMRILENKLSKYANAVLSRDSMCSRLDDRAKLIWGSVRSKMKAHGQDWDGFAMYQPPRPGEKGDFAELMAQLWASGADGQVIYTRNIKLFGLALLLSEYGWQMDVFIEVEGNEIPIDIKADTGALSVVYSPASSPKPGRVYVENHRRYVDMKIHGRCQYESTFCMASHMGQVTAQCLAKTPDDLDDFNIGYGIGVDACRTAHKGDGFSARINAAGFIHLAVPSPRCFFKKTRTCKRLLKQFYQTLPDPILAVIATGLHRNLPSCDWSELKREFDRQCLGDYEAPLFSMMLHCENRREQNRVLWHVLGAILGTLDEIIKSIIDLAPQSKVRTPSDAKSVDSLIKGSAQFLAGLQSDYGLMPSKAAHFCAARLAGVSPDQVVPGIETPTSSRYTKTSSRMTTANNSYTIGYWNAQQGILATPVFERSLRCDLPKQKSKPFTFFNTPIEGVPSDDQGWIRAAVLRPPPISQNSSKIHRSQPPVRNVALEYRPHFEGDSNNLVAAAYVNGVFYELVDLVDLLAIKWFTPAKCNHPKELPPSYHPTNRVDQSSYIDLRDLTSYEAGSPLQRQVLIAGPQKDHVSRLLTAIVFRNKTPVVQTDGCLTCVGRHAEDRNRTGVVIIPEAAVPTPVIVGVPVEGKAVVRHGSVVTCS